MNLNRLRWFATLVACAIGFNCRTAPKSTASQEYVSIDCPAGDITLTLSPSLAFELVLRHWDSAENRHTSEERLAGTWSRTGETIDLASGSTTLRYRLTKIPLTIGRFSASVEAFSWVSSSGTFADSFNLLSRVAVDAMILKARQGAK